MLAWPNKTENYYSDKKTRKKEGLEALGEKIEKKGRTGLFFKNCAEFRRRWPPL